MGLVDERAQSTGLRSLSAVVHQRNEFDRRLAMETSQDIVGADSIASVWRVRQPVSQKQDTHASSAPARRYGAKVRVHKR